MKLTKEQVQKDLDALPALYKTGDVDRRIRQYVKQKAEVSALRPYILTQQQFHRIYYYLNLICGSYFDVPFGNGVFDAAISVESLHHFAVEEKVSLYSKLCKALKSDGYFILKEYFSLCDEEEKSRRTELLSLKSEQGIEDGEFYHFDTPLTVEHECEALQKAGFASVKILKNWGATSTIKVSKETCIGRADSRVQ